MAQQMNASIYENLRLSPPPPGVIPNFLDPASRAYQMYIGMGVSIGITSVFLFLRFYVKFFLNQTCGWEDLTCLLSYVAIVTHNALAISSELKSGFLIILLDKTDKHGCSCWTRPTEVNWRSHLEYSFSSVTKEYLQRTLSAIELYALGALFVKLSLFLLYMRLFRPNKLTRWLVNVGMMTCMIFYIVSIIFNAALCVPLPSGPNDTLSWITLAAQCGRFQVYMAIAQGVFSTLSDIYLLLIPIQMVLRLNLPTKRKLAVSAVFSTGLIAIACSIGSLVCRIDRLHIVDTTWFTVDIFTLSCAEVSAGIICACAPILAPLFASAGSHDTKMFRLPASLRNLVSRWASSRSSSSSRLFLSGPKSKPRKHGQGGKYYKSSSEQDLTFEMSDGSKSIRKGTSVEVENEAYNVPFDGSNV